MARLNITNFNGKASRDTITFGYNVDLKSETNISTGLPTLQAQKKEEASKTKLPAVSGVDRIIEVGGNSSGFVKGAYTRVAGSDGPTKHTVELTCYYNVVQRTRELEFIGYGDWQYMGPQSFYGTVSMANYYYENFPDSGTEGYVLMADPTPQSDGSYAVYKYPYYREEKYEWPEWTDNWIIISSNESVTQTVGTYYKSPAKFDFMDCVSGKQWRVDAGINSLITNINSFPDYATQWKAWKDQPNLSSPCPSFDSPLSANNLNSIYAYVGKTGNFNPGDPISAAMFNGLADVINNDA